MRVKNNHLRDKMRAKKKIQTTVTRAANTVRTTTQTKTQSTRNGRSSRGSSLSGNLYQLFEDSRTRRRASLARRGILVPNVSVQTPSRGKKRASINRLLISTHILKPICTSKTMSWVLAARRRSWWLKIIHLTSWPNTSLLRTSTKRSLMSIILVIVATIRRSSKRRRMRIAVASSSTSGTPLHAWAIPIRKFWHKIWTFRWVSFARMRKRAGCRKLE